jgi:hypothetical protein
VSAIKYKASLRDVMSGVHKVLINHLRACFCVLVLCLCSETVLFLLALQNNTLPKCWVMYTYSLCIPYFFKLTSHTFLILLEKCNCNHIQ